MPYKKTREQMMQDLEDEDDALLALISSTVDEDLERRTVPPREPKTPEKGTIGRTETIDWETAMLWGKNQKVEITGDRDRDMEAINKKRLESGVCAWTLDIRPQF